MAAGRFASERLNLRLTSSSGTPWPPSSTRCGDPVERLGDGIYRDIVQLDFVSRGTGLIHEEKHGLASQRGFHHDRAAIGNRGAALAHRFAPGYAHCIFRINEADPASYGVGGRLTPPRRISWNVLAWISLIRSGRPRCRALAWPEASAGGGQAILLEPGVTIASPFLVRAI